MTPGNDSSNLTATDSKPLPPATLQKWLLPFQSLSHLVCLELASWLFFTRQTPWSYQISPHSRTYGPLHNLSTPASTLPAHHSSATHTAPNVTLSLSPQLARPLHKHIRNLHGATPVCLQLHTTYMFHAVEVKPYLPGFMPGAERGQSPGKVEAEGEERKAANIPFTFSSSTSVQKRSGSDLLGNTEQLCKSQQPQEGSF